MGFPSLVLQVPCWSRGQGTPGIGPFHFPAVLTLGGDTQLSLCRWGPPWAQACVMPAHRLRGTLSYCTQLIGLPPGLFLGLCGGWALAPLRGHVGQSEDVCLQWWGAGSFTLF